VSPAGLPDGVFSGQQYQIWFIFIGLDVEHLGIFSGHFGTFKSIWCILPTFGIFCGTLVYIVPL
jgi:hypothetical protein